eukprot:gene30255-39472_t
MAPLPVLQIIAEANNMANLTPDPELLLVKDWKVTAAGTYDDTFGYRALFYDLLYVEAEDLDLSYPRHLLLLLLLAGVSSRGGLLLTSSGGSGKQGAS